MSVRSSVASNKTAGTGTKRNRPTTPRKRAGQVCDECPLSPRRRGNTETARGRAVSLIQPAATAKPKPPRKAKPPAKPELRGKAQKSALPVKRAPRKSAGERQPRNVERGSVRKNAGKRNGGRVRNRRRERAASRRTAPDRSAPTATANPNTAPEAAKVPRATGRK